MKIRYLDMFADAGGFRSGLAKVGDFFVPVGWCEIDRYAQRAYRALYETEGEYFCDDARQIDPNDVPDIDLICSVIHVIIIPRKKLFRWKKNQHNKIREKPIQSSG